MNSHGETTVLNANKIVRSDDSEQIDNASVFLDAFRRKKNSLNTRFLQGKSEIELLRDDLINIDTIKRNLTVKRDLFVDGSIFIKNDLVVEAAATKLLTDDLVVKDSIIQVGYLEYGLFVGARIEILYDDDARCPGKILKVNNDNTYNVLLDNNVQIDNVEHSLITRKPPVSDINKYLNKWEIQGGVDASGKALPYEQGALSKFGANDLTKKDKGYFYFDISNCTSTIVFDTSNNKTLQFGNENGYININSSTGKSIIFADLSLNKNVDIKNILNVTGDTILQSRLSVNDDVSFNKNVDVSGNLNIGGNFRLENKFIAKELEVLEKSLFKGDITVNNDASFNKNVNIKEKLTTQGDTVLQNNLLVEKDASFNKNVNITGDTILQSRLSVNDDVSFNKNVDVSGNLNIEGNFRLKNKFIAKELEVLERSLFKGDITVNNDASFNENVDISGELFVKGKIGIGKKPDLTTSNKILDVSGDVNIAGNLSTTKKIKLIDQSDGENKKEIFYNNNKWSFEDEITVSITSKTNVNIAQQSFFMISNKPPNLSLCNITTPPIISSSSFILEFDLKKITKTIHNEDLSLSYNNIKLPYFHNNKIYFDVYNNGTNKIYESNQTVNANRDNSSIKITKDNVIGNDGPFKIEIYAKDFNNNIGEKLIFDDINFVVGKIPSNLEIIHFSPSPAFELYSINVKVNEIEQDNPTTEAYIKNILIESVYDDATLSRIPVPADPIIVEKSFSESDGWNKNNNQKIITDHLTDLKFASKYKLKVKGKNNVNSNYSEFSQEYEITTLIPGSLPLTPTLSINSHSAVNIINQHETHSDYRFYNTEKSTIFNNLVGIKQEFELTKKAPEQSPFVYDETAEHYIGIGNGLPFNSNQFSLITPSKMFQFIYIHNSRFLRLLYPAIFLKIWHNNTTQHFSGLLETGDRDMYTDQNKTGIRNVGYFKFNNLDFLISSEKEQDFQINLENKKTDWLHNTSYNFTKKFILDDPVTPNSSMNITDVSATNSKFFFGKESSNIFTCKIELSLTNINSTHGWLRKENDNYAIIGKIKTLGTSLATLDNDINLYLHKNNINTSDNISYDEATITTNTNETTLHSLTLPFIFNQENLSSTAETNITSEIEIYTVKDNSTKTHHHSLVLPYFDKSSFKSDFSEHIFNGVDIYYLKNNQRESFEGLSLYNHEDNIFDNSIFYREGGWKKKTVGTCWIAFKFKELKDWIGSDPVRKQYFDNQFDYELLTNNNLSNNYIGNIKDSFDEMEIAAGINWYNNINVNLKTTKGTSFPTNLNKNFIHIITTNNLVDYYDLPNDLTTTNNYYILFGSDSFTIH